MSFYKKFIFFERDFSIFHSLVYSGCPQCLVLIQVSCVGGRHEYLGTLAGATTLEAGWLGVGEPVIWYVADCGLRHCAPALAP